MGCSLTVYTRNSHFLSWGVLGLSEHRKSNIFTRVASSNLSNLPDWSSPMIRSSVLYTFAYYAFFSSHSIFNKNRGNNHVATFNTLESTVSAVGKYPNIRLSVVDQRVRTYTNNIRKTRKFLLDALRWTANASRSKVRTWTTGGISRQDHFSSKEKKTTVA